MRRKTRIRSCSVDRSSLNARIRKRSVEKAIPLNHQMAADDANTAMASAAVSGEKGKNGGSSGRVSGAGCG